LQFAVSNIASHCNGVSVRGGARIFVSSNWHAVCALICLVRLLDNMW